jgi:GTP-binding protein
MHIEPAIYIASNTTYTRCPPPDKPEIAFIGRSNVGKSSLINMLVGSKKLAKTSSTPGKTQLINHFLINQAYYMVDLPGYGWAQASQAKRTSWSKMMTEYLVQRQNLLAVLVLIDIRLPPQPIDLAFIQWLTLHHISFSIVMTKTDKVSKLQASKQVINYRKILTAANQRAAGYLLTSSASYQGRKEVMDFIDSVIADSRLAADKQGR